ncbi:MAG TPA: ATP-dependent Clp protease adaptor ClpS [bacterium]|nr:ATP-dependent Clp protease adaptor ClpS [bacterium]
MASGSGPAAGTIRGVGTRDKNETKRPALYRVVMHNDDFTPMDFVVDILVQVFQRPAAEATQVMLDIHNKGAGTAGIYTYDIAMSKSYQVHRIAEERKHPLRCTVEPA